MPTICSAPPMERGQGQPWPSRRPAQPGPLGTITAHGLAGARNRATPRGAETCAHQPHPAPWRRMRTHTPAERRRARTPAGGGEDARTHTAAERRRARASPEGWRHAHAHPCGAEMHVYPRGLVCPGIQRETGSPFMVGGGTPKIRPQQRRTSGVGGRTCLDAGVPAVGPDDEPESQAVSPPFTGTKPRFGVTLQGYCSP